MVASANRRAVGVFTTRQDTEQALNELKASGFSMDKVSVISKQAEQHEQLSGVEMSDRVSEQKVDSTGVVADTLTSATWGSILVGLGSLAVPGVGAIVAAGSIGAALAASAASTGVAAATSGNLVKALTELGIPEAQANRYGDRLQQSDYLVIVDGTENEINRAEAVLSEQGIKDWGIYPSS